MTMVQPKDRNSLKTVEKAVRILKEFSHERPEISISELSRDLDIHKSIVSRLVSTLCQSSLLQQDPDTRKIRIGVGAFRLGSIYASRQEIVRKTTPFLGTLVSRIGQSAHAMVLDGSNGLVVATVESPSALRVIMRVGEHRHLGVRKPVGQQAAVQRGGRGPGALAGDQHLGGGLELFFDLIEHGGAVR